MKKGKARWIRFMLQGDLSYVDASANATVLSYWDGGNPGTTVLVTNCAVTGQYAFAGMTGAVGLACYDPEHGYYHIVFLECP